jgi:hypothetical protein
MREVSPGDLIFSFMDTKIQAIGIAQSYCWESPKPLEFGTAGQNWEDIGWKVKVAFTALAAKIRPKDHIDILRPLLPERYPQHRLSPVIAVPAGAGRLIAREHRAQHAPRISREGILFREPPDMAGGPVFSAQRRANLDADRSRHTLRQYRKDVLH